MTYIYFLVGFLSGLLVTFTVFVIGVHAMLAKDLEKRIVNLEKVYGKRN